MYPRSFLSEEAKVKRHTSSKKELCEIGEEAIWESRFTCFFQIKKISVKQEEIMLTPSRIFFSQGSNQEPDIIIILLIRIFSCMAAVLSTSYPFFHFLIFRPYPLASRQRSSLENVSGAILFYAISHLHEGTWSRRKNLGRYIQSII